MVKKNISHEKAMKIQEAVTRKLMNYIYSYISREKFDNNILFSFNGSSEHEKMITFNVWLSLDYIVKKDKNFIELFLEEYKDNLTDNEKRILIERNKTYISLYEVEEIRGNNLILTDIFTEERKTVYQENLAEKNIYDDIIIGRIGNVLGYNKLVGIVHMVSDIDKEYLYNTILYDYGLEKKDNPDIRDLKDYLRRFSNKVYYFVDNVINKEDEMPLMSIKSETQIDKFCKHLYEKNLTKKTIDKHIGNLVNFYYYYLPRTKYSLEDITESIIDDFLYTGIFDNYISSKSEISSFITTFKKYSKFLYETGKTTKGEHNKITNISKKKDEYFEELDYLESKFGDTYIDNELYYDDILGEVVDNTLKYDTHIKNIIDQYNTEEKNLIIYDFETYINYILTNDVKVTNINKYITRKHVIALNELMKNKQEITTKVVNQDNIPLLHLFYKFGLYYSILIVDNKEINVDEIKLEEYKNLDTSEKIALFIDYIWNKCEWYDFDTSGWGKHKEEYENRNNYVKVLASLKEGKSYQYSQVINLHDSENLNNSSNGEQIDFFDLFNNCLSIQSMRFAYIFNSVIIRFFSYLSLVDIIINKDVDDYEKKTGLDIDKIKVNEIGHKVFEYLCGEKVKKKRNR
ncbi:hypothetical protein [Caldisalinibacter kiritimatiensis]|uniref:Core-binding (CB) domain-containing protein n=1 Tax=Caldisalinibacter kiritimatiensis TaxID=1304284 RepID=R1AQI0_9FIRM|nr:hypothetical protein [Caldisalinibacter kiritimatiensis]EOC99382.1 hypothetical protein L21TH_2640 [Caldisalinibacter kiritimatiensis]